MKTQLPSGHWFDLDAAFGIAKLIRYEAMERVTYQALIVAGVSKSIEISNEDAEFVRNYYKARAQENSKGNA